MNTVSLVGNLATDVELKEVNPRDGEHRKVASFLLAVGRGAGRDGGADFVWVSAWERQGELCAEYLGKGDRVGVEGRLKSRTWEQDGRRRDAVEVVARRIDFLGGGPRREGDGALAEVVPFETAAVYDTWCADAATRPSPTSANLAGGCCVDTISWIEIPAAGTHRQACCCDPLALQ